MAMSSGRWTTITESQFPWEREALDWLRGHLPDRDPWHVWSNFEFIDDDGKVNEVDALVLSPLGLFLVEIKSRPGVVSGDPHTWTWVTDGRERSCDNPLILANRKAKRLASVLRKQPSALKAKVRIPWVEPLIFLSAVQLKCKLAGTARARVYLRGQPGAAEDAGIVGVFANGVSGAPGFGLVDHHQARAVGRALVDAGVRPSSKHRRVGEYELEALIADGDNYQDWEGRHANLDTVRRRVRIYTFATAATEQARAAIVRQAAREFQILEGIDHPGILKVREYKETERGPALIFDHDANAMRLDFLLREQGARLNVDRRLHIVRQLAETLKYAHQKKLYHRALCPQSVLVRDAGAALPALQIMNWQTGTREASTGGTALRTEGTLHIEEYVEDPGRVYLAPESSWGEQGHGAHLDVFSLGAIAYHVFSGQVPASSSLELHERLRAGPGLRISDVLDGSGRSLQDLIAYSTLPDVSARFASVEDFLAALDEVEDELTAPDPETTVDPAIALANDRVEGGFTVVRRLGKGSSSDVLLVQPDDAGDEELVLKVASEPAHNDRLVAEGEILARLRHSNIVEWRRTLAVAGRTALLMRKAGDGTLAQRLKDETRLSLDLVRRFGEELIQTVDFLEGEGVAHRDIKPDNIGMSKVGTKGRLQLVLFDFSLARTPPDNISAGTHPYLDPFLSLRRPPRWDLYAERYALAVTLYEMVVGDPPRWGDGLTQPAMLDCEVTLDAERFDPHLREGLIAFFEKALRRDFRERFDNAEEMLRAWRRVFEESQPQGAEADEFEAIAHTAVATTSIAELGYGVEAQNVLEGMGVHNVRELLAVDRIKFRYLKGVGDRIRKEIRLKAKRLAQLRPDLVQGRGTVHGEGEPAGVLSVDHLVAALLPRRPAGDDRPEERALAIYLGLEEADGDRLWSTLGFAAAQCRIPRSAASGALLKARERWLKAPAITDLRNELEALLDRHAGVMTVPELAHGLLAAHGSAQQDDALRLRIAAAVLRAACEAESQLAAQRFQAFDHEPATLVARNAELADYAKRLAAAADEAAGGDALLAPQRALELLQTVARPQAVALLSPQRLLRLASAASWRAALSSRQELYPRGMAAAQAVRQSLGALAGPRFLTADDIAERVRGRYAEAEPLPPRPALDALLAAAGASLHWSDTGPSGPGYYAPPHGLGPSAGTTTCYARHGTEDAGPVELTNEIAEARRFEERLAFAARSGGFLVLTVSPRLARHAAAELVRRFGMRRLSLDALLLDALREAARALKVDWKVVLRADRAAEGSRDRTNLARLVQKSAPAVRERLMQADAPVLMIDTGLLARYQLMGLVEELRDRAGAPGSPPGLWMLVPMATHGLPAIDGVPVPVISSAQWAHIPSAWIENAHRAGTAAGMVQA